MPSSDIEEIDLDWKYLFRAYWPFASYTRARDKKIAFSGFARIAEKCEQYGYEEEAKYLRLRQSIHGYIYPLYMFYRRAELVRFSGYIAELFYQPSHQDILRIINCHPEVVRK